MKRELLAGKKDDKKAKHVEPEDVVGKTVSAVVLKEVEGAYGTEKCYEIQFADGTETGFVVPNDDDDEDFDDQDEDFDDDEEEEFDDEDE